MIDLQDFILERNEALLSMNEEKIKAYMMKWSGKVPTDRGVFWLAVHKARVMCKGLEMVERAASLRWLAHHGSSVEHEDRILVPESDVAKYKLLCEKFGVPYAPFT